MNEIMRKENDVGMRQAGRVMDANAEANAQNISPDEFYKQLKRYESATNEDILAEMLCRRRKIYLLQYLTHFS